MAEGTTYETTGTSPGVAVSGGGTGRDETMTGLLRRLADDLSTLFRKEIALARAELKVSLNEAKTGIASVAAGGAVLFAGFLVLLAMAVLALAEVMEPWAAALIVGAVVTIVGFIMLQAGRKKLDADSLDPSLTRESLRKDKEMVQNRTSS